MSTEPWSRRPARLQSPKRPSLDDLDRELLQALREDGRMPLAALGSRVGLSGDAARERLRHMTETGVLQVTASIDPAMLGFNTLALIGVTVSGAAEAIAAELVDVPEFDLVGCVAGRYDVLVEAVCRDDAHLLQTIDEHIRSRPDVSGIIVFSYLEVLKFSPGGVPQPTAADVPPVVLSQADLDVIGVLRQDGRASYQDIADRTQMPYQMARRRARSLLESGVLRIETLVNRLTEGTAVVASVGLTTAGPVSRVAPPVVALEEVEVAVVSAGPFDLHLEVVCRDRRHLSEVVGEKIRAIPGVIATETTVYQRLLKLPQNWSGLVRPS